MRLTASRADAFLDNPEPSVNAALFHGPDRGLVRERGGRLLRRLTVTPDDPFAVARLDGAGLAPGRLADEALAIPLGGGRRVVRVSDATDALTPDLARCLELSPEATVILEAGELSKSSKLRKLCETADNAVSIGCYPEEGADLIRWIRDSLGQVGVEIEPDAAVFVAESLAEDRAVARAELEKIELFAKASDPPSVVRREDVVACIGRSSESALDDIAYAAADGDHGETQRLLAAADADGASPVAILRAAQRHFLRLQLAGAQMAGGKPAKQAMAGLRPPVFFKRADRFAAQLRNWSKPGGSDRLAQALEGLCVAERDCKRTHMPDRALCGRALLGVTRLARG